MKQEVKSLLISLIYQDLKDLSLNIFPPILFLYYYYFLIFLETWEFYFFSLVIAFSRISLEEKDFTIHHHLFQRKLVILFSFVEETQQIFHLFIKFLLVKFKFKVVRISQYSPLLPFRALLFSYFLIHM